MCFLYLLQYIFRQKTAISSSFYLKLCTKKDLFWSNQLVEPTVEPTLFEPFSKDLNEDNYDNLLIWINILDFKGVIGLNVALWKHQLNDVYNTFKH